MEHLPWWVKTFLALGGAGLIWKAATQGIPNAVGAGMKWLLSHPAIKAAVVANKERIEAILEASEKEIIKDIEEASATPDAAPKA